MSWQPDNADDGLPPCTGVWQALPAGYDPVAPIVDPNSPTLPLMTRILPLLMLGPDNLPVSRNPRIGTFVPSLMTPPPMDGPDSRPKRPYLLDGNTFFRNTGPSYLKHAFRIGVDVIGDPDAVLGGDKIGPMHGALPNDTTQTDELPVEVILP